MRDSAPTGLTWDAPAQCPDREVLVERIEELASAEGGVDPWRGASAIAVVTPADDGLRVRLELRTPQGRSEHEFTAGDCDEAVEVVTLETAMMLDAVRTVDHVEVMPEEPPPPKPAAPPATKPTPKEPTPPVVAPAVERRPRVRGRARIVGGASFGFPERITGIFEAGFALDVSALRVAASAVLTTPERVTHPDFPDEGASIMAFGGAADLCFVPGRRRVSVPLCAGLEAGALRASGFGVSDPQVAFRPYVAPRVRTGILLEVAPHVVLALEGTTPIVVLRPVFDIGGLGRLYRAPIGSFRALAGIQFWWGRS